MECHVAGTAALIVGNCLGEMKEGRRTEDGRWRMEDDSCGLLF